MLLVSVTVTNDSRAHTLLVVMPTAWSLVLPNEYFPGSCVRAQATGAARLHHGPGRGHGPSRRGAQPCPVAVGSFVRRALRGGPCHLGRHRSHQPSSVQILRPLHHGLAFRLDA